MTAVADKLREARALIERGWTRNVFRRGSRYCAIGAVNSAIHGNAYEIPGAQIWDDAYELLKSATGEAIPVTDWNDVQPSKRPVLAAFDKAIELADAPGG